MFMSKRGNWIVDDGDVHSTCTHFFYFHWGWCNITQKLKHHKKIFFAGETRWRMFEISSKGNIDCNVKVVRIRKIKKHIHACKLQKQTRISSLARRLCFKSRIFQRKKKKEIKFALLMLAKVLFYVQEHARLMANMENSQTLFRLLFDMRHHRNHHHEQASEKQNSRKFHFPPVEKAFSFSSHNALLLLSISIENRKTLKDDEGDENVESSCVQLWCASHTHHSVTEHTQKPNDRHRTSSACFALLRRQRQRCDLDFSIIHSCVVADDVDEDENDDVIRILFHYHYRAEIYA